MSVEREPGDSAAVLRAVDVIAPYILRSPLIRSEPLSVLTHGDVFLKLENLQRTGSFKVRGAANRMLALTSAQRERGVVACSSGNHGRAVAYVAERLGIRATICVPRWVDPVKLAAMESCGAIVDAEGIDYDAAARRASQIERRDGYTFIHPFDDHHIVAGQGTIALEILSAEPRVDAILAALSGGGLIAGIGLGVRAAGSDCRVHAVSAENANVMAASLSAGKPIELAEDKTIASALSGGIGLDNKWTFRLVQALVDEHATVDEGAIVNGIRFLADEHRLVVEGGGAAAVASVLAAPTAYAGKRIAVVISGGNIDLGEWMRLQNDG